MRPLITVRSESYLEKCIAALPAEKREAARAAFAEISDTGDDCYLSKLLAVLEANNTYARTIPRELAAVHQQFLSDLTRETTDIRRELIAAERTRDVALRKLLYEEVHTLDKTLPLTRTIEELHTNSRSLEQLQKAVSEQSTGLAAFCIVCIIGALVAGAIFFMSGKSGANKDPEELRVAQDFLDTMSAAGIWLGIQKTAKGERLTVQGPNAKPEVGWCRDASGNIAGVEIVYTALPTR